MFTLEQLKEIAKREGIEYVLSKHSPADCEDEEFKQIWRDYNTLFYSLASILDIEYCISCNVVCEWLDFKRKLFKCPKCEQQLLRGDSSDFE